VHPRAHTYPHAIARAHDAAPAFSRAATFLVPRDHLFLLSCAQVVQYNLDNRAFEGAQVGASALLTECCCVLLCVCVCVTAYLCVLFARSLFAHELFAQLTNVTVEVVCDIMTGGDPLSGFVNLSLTFNPPAEGTHALARPPARARAGRWYRPCVCSSPVLCVCGDDAPRVHRHQLREHGCGNAEHVAGEPRG
jgi:hypothetical protein